MGHLDRQKKIKWRSWKSEYKVWPWNFAAIWMGLCYLPAGHEDEGTYWHGKMALSQLRGLNNDFLMPFRCSRFFVFLCQSHCNYDQWILLVNEPSEYQNPCIYKRKIKSRSKLTEYSDGSEPTFKASSMLCASSKSLETKFRPIAPATISSSVGGTEFSVNAWRNNEFQPSLVSPHNVIECIFGI